MARKHARIGSSRLPVCELTAQQLAVVKKGLVCFEEVLRHNTHIPNYELVHTSYQRVCAKVLVSLAEGERVDFDYNELTIIATCLDMVVVDASFLDQPTDFQIAVILKERVHRITTGARSR